MASGTSLALLTVLAFNGLLMLGQLAVYEINPSGTHFYDCKGNIFDKVSGNGCNTDSQINSNNALSQMPSGSTGVSPSTGNIFTDTISTISSWFINNTGASFVLNILSGPYTILKIFLPNNVAFVIGMMWYAITLFLIISFLLGRQLE